MMLASSTLVMLEVCSVWAVSVTVRVKDSADNGVAGVKVRYGVGSTYTTWWFNGGTLTNASGEVTAELATGTYSFQAVYRNGHAEVIGQDVGADNIVDFRTCKLTLRLECCDSSTGIAGARARYGAG